jgi:hypothetical protein
MYVPTRTIDVQSVMAQLRVRYIKPQEDQLQDEYAEEVQVSAQNEEICCYDLSVPGYIGVPRTYAIEKLNVGRFVDRTVYKPPMPEKFVKHIEPRDAEQREFMNTLAALVRGPKPVDIVANARTGTGKTVTALWLVERAIQAPTLVTVPTTYLLNQWRNRISGLMGRHWFDLYVGHIQQGKMDYRGRLICIGLAPSLARRDYPTELRRYFSALIFDEWHKIPTPSIHGILAKYPASVRIGLTATNRRDALYKVARLHLGSPRVVSKQEVMRPQVYIVPFQKALPRSVPYPSERWMVSLLAKFHDRNRMLVDLLFNGYRRGRHIVGLSDRTEQLVTLMRLLRELLPENERGNVGLLVDKYPDGNGRKIKMPQAEREHTAANCRIILATYGLFDTGADVDRLDMGVELTPRSNLRQAIGRVLRIMPGKPVPEWYSVRDTIMVYSDAQRAAPTFMPDRPEPYEPLLEMANARLASFEFQRGTVRELYQ